MGFNSFRGRRRGRGKYTAKGRRRYHGSKKLKRIARRARYRTSARAQGRQIAKVAGSLASVKGKRKREEEDDPEFAVKRQLNNMPSAHGTAREGGRLVKRFVKRVAQPALRAAVRRAAINYSDRAAYAYSVFDWVHSLAGPIIDHSDML